VTILTDTIFVIPCSGIGKAFGTISRDTTYRVVEDLRKGETDTLCLSLLVMGDDEARRLVKLHRCISVDGCPSECSKKNLSLSGASLAASFRVLDLLRENKALMTQSVTFLDENGRKLSELLAGQIALKVDELKKEGDRP
jgi:uncharacterized metal-binding protein